VEDNVQKSPFRKYKELNSIDEPVVKRRAAVAYLYKAGMPPGDIGQELQRLGFKHISAPNISDDLNYLVSHEIIRNEISSDLAPELVDDIDSQFTYGSWESLRTCLHEKSGGALKDLRVFYSGAFTKQQDGFQKWLAVFARNARTYLAQRLREANCIGVTGGRTVAALIQAQADFVNSDCNRSAELVPLSGKPPKGSKYSATQVAEELSRKLKGSAGDVRSLEGLPHAPEDWNTVSGWPAYEEIFGPKRLCERPLEMILTGAGCFHQWKVWGTGKGSVNLSDSALRNAGAVGEIGLTLVPRSGLSSKIRKEFDKWTAHGTSISLESIRRLSHDAVVKESISGVCLAVLGSNKLDIAKALLVEQKCVNILMTDIELALALEKALDCRP
jgi:DNA-binding transcriptional regulator LsrR (DeoR family)